VFVTGGPAMLPQFASRLHNELVSIRPCHSQVCVYTARDPVIDSWRGARRWANMDPACTSSSVTAAEYWEMGGAYLKEHSASNRANSSVL